MSSSSSSSDDKVENTRAPVGAEAAGSESPPSHRSSPARSTNGQPAHAAADSGSERSEATPPRRRNLLASDDDEDDDSQKSPREDGDTTAAASHLFGDDVSSDSDDERGDAKKRARERDSDAEGAEGANDSDGSIQGIRLYPDQDEEQEQEEEAPPTIVEGDGVYIQEDLGDSLWHCKLPNFLSIETKPFDQDEYEDNEDDENIDGEGRNRLKLKVENTLRWRTVVDADGTERRESNAKFVRWSDGTMSMYLGNEIFEIQEMPLVADTHLFIRHESGLMSQEVFDKKIQFRPHSTDSKTHRKVTLNMADRTRKSGQVKIVDINGMNPDELKKDAVRKEEEQLRAAIRRDTQVRRVRDNRPRHGLTSGFLEDRDDSDEDHRGGRYRRGEAPLIGASDSEDSGDGGRRLEGAKQDESDSDEEFRKKKLQQKKKIVSSDEESD